MTPDLAGLPRMEGEDDSRTSPARPIRPRDEFVTAWLLLLVDRGASYGYQLRGELDAHSVSIDPAVVYRTLRRLEGDGSVTSRWIESGVGPRRRSYTVTTAGRQQLDAAAGVISSLRDLHDSFLAEHRHALARRGRPSA